MKTINLMGTGSGAPQSVAMGSLIVPAGSGPTLIRNSDQALGCFVSSNNAIDTSTLSNAVSLDPTGTIVVDGQSDVFAIGNFGIGTIALQIINGGISFFQRLSSLTLVDPVGTDYIRLITGSPPEIEIGTGDPAESSPAELTSTIVGSGATRQLGVGLTANTVTGEPVGSFAIMELVSPPVGTPTAAPGISMIVSDSVHSNSLSPTVNNTNSVQPYTTNALSGPPVALALGSFFSGVGGNSLPSASSANGFSGSVVVSQSDAVATTVTAAAFTRLSKQYTVPALDANTASCYRITAWGTGTQGSTQQTLSFRLNAFNNTGASSGYAATFAAVSQTFVWLLTGVVQVTVTGGTATIQFNWQCDVKVSGASSSQTLSGGAVTGSGDTVSSHIFQLESQWGAVLGAPTITCAGSMFERVGA